MFSVAGRTALVTGGATGIGYAISDALASGGANVLLTHHHHDAVTALAELRKYGGRCEALNVDFSRFNQKEARDLVGNAEALLGPIDILVNNAGAIYREAAFDYAEKEWHRIMSINLDAQWFLSQAVAKRMLPRKWGKIISIASVLGFQGGIRVPAYAASKHGLIGMTKALANELAISGINVNAIAPGYTTTDNTFDIRMDKERIRDITSRIPAGRFAEPDEIAPAVIFLASDASRYVHGAVLPVDGGWLSR